MAVPVCGRMADAPPAGPTEPLPGPAEDPTAIARPAAWVLAAVAVFALVAAASAAVSIHRAPVDQADVPGGQVSLELRPSVAPADGGAIPEFSYVVEDIHGDWQIQGESGVNGAARVDVPQARAVVTIVHEGKQWVRQIWVPEDQWIGIELWPDRSPETTQGVVRPPDDAFGMHILQALGAAVGLAAALWVLLRRRAGWPMVYAWLGTAAAVGFEVVFLVTGQLVLFVAGLLPLALQAWVTVRFTQAAAAGIVAPAARAA